jgi:hypothetical protein
MYTGERTKVGLAWLPAHAAEAGGGEPDKTRLLNAIMLEEAGQYAPIQVKKKLCAQLNTRVSLFFTEP